MALLIKRENTLKYIKLLNCTIISICIPNSDKTKWSFLVITEWIFYMTTCLSTDQLDQIKETAKIEITTMRIIFLSNVTFIDFSN